MKSFKQYLQEGLQDLKGVQFKDKFDKDFALYALNEIPIKWNQEERKACSKLYGNVDVGVVYHGNRINSEEQLEYLQSLKPGKTFKANLISATHYKDDALSFMQFVKSYDEMLTYLQLKSALERGSSGQYGSFLLALEPTKEQVIASTFGNPREKFTRTAETECILYGDIKIHSIKIIELLTKENWFETVKNSFPEILSLHFLQYWIEHHKIKPSKSQVLDLINSLKGEDVLMFFKYSKVSHFILDMLTADDIKDNKAFTKTFEQLLFKGHHLYFKIGEEKISINNKSINDYLIEKNKTIVKKSVVEHYKEIKDKPYHFTVSKDKPLFTFDENAIHLIEYIKLMQHYKIKVSHPILNQIKEANKQIETYANEFLSKTLNDYNVNDLIDLRKLFTAFKDISYFNKVIEIKPTYIKKAFQHFYHSFARGLIKDTNLLKRYSEILNSVLSDQEFLTTITT